MAHPLALDCAGISHKETHSWSIVRVMMDGSFTQVTTLIALLIQGFLLFYAYRTVKQNAETAKKRAIVDHIIKQREDKELRRIFQELYKLRAQHQKFRNTSKTQKGCERFCTPWTLWNLQPLGYVWAHSTSPFIKSYSAPKSLKRGTAFAAL